MVFKKAAVQVLLLLAGIAMLIFGIWREEAQTVFSKAIRLCMDCVGIGQEQTDQQKKCAHSCTVSRLDSGSSSTSDQHASPQFFEWFSESGKGKIRLCAGIELLFLSGSSRLLSHRGISGSCRVIEIQVFLLCHRNIDIAWCFAGEIYLWISVSVRLVSGAFA